MSVSALVYVAARAPDAGEDFGAHPREIADVILAAAGRKA